MIDFFSRECIFHFLFASLECNDYPSQATTHISKNDFIFHAKHSNRYDFDPEEEEEQELRSLHRIHLIQEEQERRRRRRELIESTSTASGLTLSTSSSTALLPRNNVNQRQKQFIRRQLLSNVQSSPDDNLRGRDFCEQELDDDNLYNIILTGEGEEEEKLNQELLLIHQNSLQTNDMRMPCSESTSFLDSRRLDKDKIEESLSCISYGFIILSLLLFIFNVTTDLLVILEYEARKEWGNFYASLGILIFSFLIVNIFSLKW